MDDDVLVIERHGRRLSVAGELDILTAPLLVKAIDDLVLEAPEPITIDTSKITFCDSSGIRCLLAAASQVEVIILDPQTQLLRLCDLLGIASKFTITATGTDPIDTPGNDREGTDAGGTSSRTYF